MKTVQINTYSFSELSDKAKEKALNHYRYLNVDYADWDEYILEEEEKKLESLGYSDVNILYSGFWTQGDGACFTASIDIKKWLEAHKLTNKYKLLYVNSELVTMTLIHNNYYCHSTTTELEDICYFQDLPEAKKEKLYRQVNEIEKLILEEREELGDNIYKTLQQAYVTKISDEAVRDTIEANEYYFLEDGGLFNII